MSLFTYGKHIKRPATQSQPRIHIRTCILPKHPLPRQPTYHISLYTETPKHSTCTMSEHNYKFEVAMSCGGCSGAVERVLKKLDGATPTYAACSRFPNEYQA